MGAEEMYGCSYLRALFTSISSAFINCRNMPKYLVGQCVASVTEIVENIVIIYYRKIEIRSVERDVCPIAKPQ